MSIRELIFSANVDNLSDTLKANPKAANTWISLPDNPSTAHPLHRICDGICCGFYSEATGIEMARIFLNHGADLNNNIPTGKDSPLTAACSLRCDQLALFYIQQGARIDHRGCHGGTALHWSSWCGRDIIVEKLITMNPDINQRCIDFKSTPLFWAIHGYQFGEKDNRHHQINCARMLLEHGADPSIPNFEGYLPVQLAKEQDEEILSLFKQP